MESEIRVEQPVTAEKKTWHEPKMRSFGIADGTEHSNNDTTDGTARSS